MSRNHSDTESLRQGPGHEADSEPREASLSSIGTSLQQVKGGTLCDTASPQKKRQFHYNNSESNNNLEIKAAWLSEPMNSLDLTSPASGPAWLWAELCES